MTMAEFDEKIHDDIDRYLQGKMDAQEHARFDQAMAGDPVLKEEVNFQRTLISAVKHARKQELKEYIRANAGAEAAGSGAGSGMKIMRLAAAFLLVGGAAFFIYTQTKTETDKDQVAIEQGPHGAGELADRTPDDLDSIANRTTPEAGVEDNQSLADNARNSNVQPPPMNPPKKSEDKKTTSTPPSNNELATSEDANTTLKGSSAPSADAKMVTVEKVYDTPQRAAGKDLGRKTQMRVDFNPGADLTGYRI
jgi:hypothetical protein